MSVLNYELSPQHHPDLANPEEETEEKLREESNDSYFKSLATRCQC